ncbi:hypothetical protein ZWY2020_052087 [Hordeum vulgare]|nr:hypothetical protein ZWY2020_052087 [Hordeum vulgare]
MEYGARALTTCLEIAVQNGGRFAMNPCFVVMPDDQLHDTLLARRLPTRPTTQPNPLAHVEVVLFTVKLPEEYHIPHCIEHLVGSRPPHPDGKHDASSSDVKPKTDVDLDKALNFLDRGCTVLNLAVKHINLAYISPDGPYPSSD